MTAMFLIIATSLASTPPGIWQDTWTTADGVTLYFSHSSVNDGGSGIQWDVQLMS